MLDLFAGRGGASSAMQSRPDRWDVIRVELDERFAAEHRDVRTYQHDGRPVDLLWASPPCTEFSRESMPWCKTGNAPDLGLVWAAKLLIERIRPRWWVIENVRGAPRWLTPALGRPVVVGSLRLWGTFPAFLASKHTHYKTKISGLRPDLRSMVPGTISTALADACERDVNWQGESR